MKILVTGGAGFIGRHLVKSLVAKGHAVTIFDNFSNSSKNGIADLLKDGVDLIESNILDIESLSKAVNDQDAVIHLAAKISVAESIKNPAETFRVNVDGTKNIFELCLKKGVMNVISASSAAVYGNSTEPSLIQTEDSPTSPISPYGESKLKMEQFVREFSLQNKINSIILRFFNIYGIGQTGEYAGVISKFIQNTIQKKPFTIFGDGMQTRDFIYIEDVIDAINQSLINIKNKHGNTYNIASGKSVTIKNLAEIIASVANQKINIVHEHERKGDIRFSRALVDLARSDLQFTSKVVLDEGLRKLFGLLNSKSIN